MENKIISDIVENIITPSKRAFLSKVIEDSIDDTVKVYWGPNWKKEKTGDLKTLYDKFKSTPEYNLDVSCFYSVYQLPQNIHKLQIILLDLLRTGKLSTKIKILDLGSCTGTSTLAIVDFFEIIIRISRLYGVDLPEVDIEIDSLEASEDNIKIFNELQTNFKGRQSQDYCKINKPIQCEIGSIDWHKKVPKKEYDLIILSDFLCEFEDIGDTQSVAEDLFVERFIEKYGVEAKEFLNPQYPFKDFEGKDRYIDFAIFTDNKKFAIEIDGRSYHSPENIQEEKYDDDLKRQRALTSDGWIVYRWTYSQLLEIKGRLLNEFDKDFGKDPQFKKISETSTKLRESRSGIAINELELLRQFSNFLSDNGNLIIIEPANVKSSRELHSLQKAVIEDTGLTLVSPCGKLHQKCEGCKQCRSFRQENLKIPKILEAVDLALRQDAGSSHFERYSNERLKWTYSIYNKSETEYIKQDKYKDLINLSEIDENVEGKYISVLVEVVSDVLDNRGRLSLCDQSPVGSNKITLVPGNGVVLPRLKYGDLIYVENVLVKRKGDKKQEFDLVVTDDKTDPAKNTVINNISRGEESTIKRYIQNPNIEDLQFFMMRFWGFGEFKEGQYEIMERVLKGRSVLGILPTGGGKSLCFQMPAFLTPGVALVISPLKSLMKDQISNLNKAGFDFVDYIDSSRTSKEKEIILKRFRKGYLKLLYIAPERLVMRKFQDEVFALLKGTSINYFVVDEAHCISEWGHDFRPSYLQLRNICREFKDPPIIGVTATASKRVREDIVRQLELSDEDLVTPTSFDRPELSFQVIPVPDGLEKNEMIERLYSEENIDWGTMKGGLAKILGYESLADLHLNNSGIIFTIYGNPSGKTTRPFGTESVLKAVQKVGIDARSFYSAKGEKEKIEIQEKFKDNEFPLLVSTKGYGMGIDKPNIEYIIHFNHPQSLEGYYQEAGRAGRDGEHAHCVMLYSPRSAKCKSKFEDSYGDIAYGGGSLTKKDSLGPKCAVEGKWTCPYGLQTMCDYGRQAKFIEGEYPSDIIDTVENFYREISNLNKTDGWVEYEEKNPDAKPKEEKIICDLQNVGLIEKYYVNDYSKSKYGGYCAIFKIKFPDQSLNFNESLEKISHTYTEFKKRRYYMLQMIENYGEGIAEEGGSRCRRSILMSYFGDPNIAGDYSCNFCDVEGISEERASKARPRRIIQKLFTKLENEFKGPLDIANLNDLIIKARKLKVITDFKVRSLRILEDYPNNYQAIYVSGITALLLNDKIFGEIQILNLLRYLLDSEGFEQLDLSLLGVGQTGELDDFTSKVETLPIFKNDLLRRSFVKTLLEFKDNVEYQEVGCQILLEDLNPRLKKINTLKEDLLVRAVKISKAAIGE